MFKTNTSTRKIIIGLSVTLLAGLLLALYFLKSVPEKEEELNIRGFRILARIEQNILDKKQGVLKTIDNIYSKALFAQTSTTGKLINKLPKEYRIEGLDYTGYITRDTWHKKWKDRQFKPEFDIYKEKWDIKFFGDYYDKYGDFLYRDTTWILTYNFDFNNFIEKVIDYRNDFFEEYMILLNDSIVYQSKKLAYENALSAHLPSGTNKLLTSYVKRDTLAGKEYYVFYQPFDKSSEIKFVLCGLIPVEKYNAAKYHINISLIIAISLLFVLLILSLPFVKIITMSSFERLLRLDVIGIIVSLALGASLVAILLLFQLNNRHEIQKQRQTIKSLNDTIENRFSNEIKLALEEMKCYEEDFQSNNTIKNWYKENLKKDYGVEGKSISSLFNGQACYHYTESLLLINNEGIAKARWLENGDNLPDIDLEERNYYKVFSDSILSKGYSFDSTNNFYIQSIYSWQNQQNTVVVSKKPDKATYENLKNINKKDLAVIALETRLFSLMNVALPAEIAFCIIDDAGNVLFHSDERRNLRENFIEECDKNAFIKAALYNRTDVELNIKYYGKNNLAHISPVSNLPFYVVTFYDNTPYFDLITDKVIFTLAMSLCVILLLSFILISFYMATNRVSYLRKQKISLGWISFTQENLRGYRMQVLFLAALFGISALFSYFMRGFDLLCFSFIIPVTALALFTINIYRMSYHIYIESPNFRYIKWRFNILLGICLFIILAIVTTRLLICDSQRFDSISFGLFIVGVILFVFSAAIYYRQYSNGFKARISQETTMNAGAIKSAQQYFTPAAYILLVITIGALPSANFYDIAGVEEYMISQKRKSTDIAKTTAKRENWLSANFNGYIKKIGEKGHLDILNIGIYSPDVYINFDTVAHHRLPDFQPAAITVSDFYANVITLTKSRPDEYETKELYMNHSSSTDSSWIWNDISRQLTFSFSGNTSESKVKGIIIKPIENEANTWFYYSKVAFWALSIIILLLVYALIVYIYKKITLYDYFYDLGLRINNKYFIENIDKEKTNLLIIALPGTDIITDLRNNIIQKKYDVESEKSDLLTAGIKHTLFTRSKKKLPGEAVPEKILLLPFFELKGNDPNKYADKLKTLEDSFADKSLKVIWITSSDPFELIEALRKNDYRDLKQKIKDKENANNYYRLEHDYDKILRILDDFHKINYAFEENTAFENSTKKSVLPYTQEIIKEEFRYSHFLHNLHDIFIHNNFIQIYSNSKHVNLLKYDEDESLLYRKNLNIDEIIILKIQDMAKNFYYSIWACLNSKEKYVLYDLALDDLTNYRNLPILVELKEKGILVFDKESNKLKIFNKSFRNFILTTVDPEEALLLEKEINISGTWEITRMVLFIMFIAFGSFLFFTQQIFFNKIFGLATTLVSVIPLIINFITNASGLSKTTK